jgi:hypothetical protein
MTKVSKSLFAESYRISRCHDSTLKRFVCASRALPRSLFLFPLLFSCAPFPSFHSTVHPKGSFPPFYRLSSFPLSIRLAHSHLRARKTTTTTTASIWFTGTRISTLITQSGSKNKSSSSSQPRLWMDEVASTPHPRVMTACACLAPTKFATWSCQVSWYHPTQITLCLLLEGSVGGRTAAPTLSLSLPLSLSHSLTQHNPRSCYFFFIPFE